MSEENLADGVQAEEAQAEEHQGGDQVADDVGQTEASEGQEAQAQEPEPAPLIPIEADPKPKIAIFREQYKKVQKENEELKARLRSTGGLDPSQAGQPKKPSLWDADIDGDEDKLTEKLAGWLKDQIVSESKIEAQKDQINEKHKKYEKAKAQYDKDDYEDCEHVVRTMFSQTQQAILIDKFPNAAKIVAEIGSNPEKAEALSNIKDNLDFAFALKDLDYAMTQKNKKPEQKIGAERMLPKIVGSANATDSTLELMRKQAEKDGDYSKIAKYKKERGLI